MDKERQQKIYELLKRGLKLAETGEELPAEWAREFFPPERREYELVYNGKESEEQILADTMAVPLQPVSTFGQNGVDWHNKLIFGDNLQAMKTLLQMKERGELVNADGTPGVRLVYIDPPFGTGDEYSITDDLRAYSAKLQGSKFIEFLRKRLILLRELLAADGSIYIRIDYHFGHYIKAVADEVFGPQFFRNEIVINRFKRQLRGLNQFNVATDSLFLYSKSGNPVFNEQLRSRLCSFCGQMTEPQWLPMTSPGLRNPPERIILGQKLLPPKGRHWTFTQARIIAMEKEGRIRIENTSTWTDLDGDRHRGVPEYLQTEETPTDSSWTDLKGYVRSARYPTENPEELLERVVRASSNEGDIVIDSFAGSGTTCAVAEKLKRRWIGIDSGKLAIYTIQKRMLNLREEIGNSGKPLAVKSFTLYNAGLYDFETLRQLPWEGWRSIALQLFECKDEPHKIRGFQMDGKRQGSSVYVFNHFEKGKISRETIADLHASIGKQVGERCFVVAPRGAFLFQEDYIEMDNVRYYALRIPYSYINEVHRREFSALIQPSDERAVNETVEAVGFDFIQPPLVELEIKARGVTVSLKIKKFESRARVKGKEKIGRHDTLSMVMVDFNYNGKVFDLDKVFYATALKDNGWKIEFPRKDVTGNVMLVFLDIYGNESRGVIEKAKLAQSA
ncbi:MAG: site-specific DNA-methyltransferase [Candidatus Brocadiaceae bacterium]